MKEPALVRGIREAILLDPARLQAALLEEELPFAKVMRNLVFGTNRSVFTATIGREQENVEQWRPGKPLRRLNMRATVANFRPDRAAESLYINTYRDDRELAIHLLPDSSRALYPSTALFGLPDPFQSHPAAALVCQSLVRSIARDYDSTLLCHPRPDGALAAARLDTKDRSLRPFLAPLERPSPPFPGLRPWLAPLLTAPLAHAVAVLVAHESLFDQPDRDEVLADLRIVCLRNDVIFLALCDDWEARFARAPGPFELALGDSLRRVASEPERRAAAAALAEARARRFALLDESGIAVCPLCPERPGWSRALADFFRTRLVLS